MMAPAEAKFAYMQRHARRSWRYRALVWLAVRVTYLGDWLCDLAGKPYRDAQAKIASEEARRP